ncbi:MAG TPA: cytochrome c biogenesis protein ResB, partial [bacterium]|nr:cytochrome c biogenesis protein ResB [bacterium]
NPLLNKFFQIPLVRFLASVKLALPMLLILAALLAAGTIVESLYTASLAKRFVYDTWWFTAFLALLGLNVLLSALSRFPWKKHQIGFVITHLGILCVLAGSFLTQRWGTDGQIAVAEGGQGSIFQEDKPILTCQVGSRTVRRIPAGFPNLEPRPSFPFSYRIGDDARLTVDRFYLNARRLVGAKPAGPGEKGSAAVRLKLESSFVQEADWLFLGRQGQDRVDLGPASVFFLSEGDWKSKSDREKNGLPPNALVLIERPQGDWLMKTRHRGAWAPAKALALGQSLPTGWMDMKATVTQALSRAVPDVSYAPVPLAAQEPQPALRFTARSGGQVAESWVGYEDQVTFTLNSKPWRVTYGPRQAPLPFSLALQKFHLGFDPGTQNPASYVSDVEAQDLATGEKFPAVIRMNQPLHYRGYTVYQASYFPMEDGRYTSVFSVGRDPGLVLKYAGALVMVLGIIFMFWFKNPAWKKREKDEEKPLETPGDGGPAAGAPGGPRG